MFEAVLGHESTLEGLRKHTQGRQDPPFSFYVMAGPSRVGKFRVAEEFVAAWMPTEQCSEGCNSCSGCGKMSRNTCPDYFLVQSKGSISIDQIRELTSAFLFKPYGAQRKAAIIRADKGLMEPAQHALLKLAEEPLGKALIVLIVPSEHSLLETVRSRACLVSFGFLSQDLQERMFPGTEIRDGQVYEDYELSRYETSLQVFLNAARTKQPEVIWGAELEEEFVLYVQRRIERGCLEINQSLEDLARSVARRGNTSLQAIRLYSLLRKTLEEGVLS